MLGLRFCARAFSSCDEQGPLFIAVRGPLTIAASLVAGHRLQTCRLSSCGSRASCFAACGILPDQGSNLCPLHWQADSQPLRHQGSPGLFVFCCWVAWAVCIFWKLSPFWSYHLQIFSSIGCVFILFMTYAHYLDCSPCFLRCIHISKLIKILF